MRYFLLLLFLCTTSTLLSQNVQVFGLSNMDDQYSKKAVYDNAGNMFIVGSFKGNNFDVDPSSGTYYLNNQGQHDFYVAKYSSTGAFISAIGIGGTDTDEATSIAIDGSGNIYVTGWFRNTIDFDPSGAVANVVSNGHSNGTDMGYDGDVFLAKYSNNLSYQWVFNVGGSYVNDAGIVVKIDHEGNVLLGGNFRGNNIDFDPSPATALRSAAGVIESFIAKYTSTGQFVWVSTFGGVSTVSGQVRDIGVQLNGDIIVCGHFDGSIDLDPSGAANVVNSAGCGDVYVVKLNSSGQHQWGFKLGGTQCDYPLSIALDGSGNFYMTGYFASSNVDFNPGPATNTFSSVNSNYDIFVSKYDHNGNYLFAQSFGGTGNDVGFGIYATDNSYILVGYFEGTIDIDASASTNSLTSAGGQDGFVAGYYLNGQYNNGFRFGGPSNDVAYNVTKRTASEFTVTGYYEGVNVDFDPGAPQALLTSEGAKDAFFAVYSVVVLPVKLIEFSAIKNGKQNDLKWITLQELNVSHYGIERSNNGIEFTSIGQLNSFNLNERNTYTFADVSPMKGTNYYRLRIVDANGKSEFSSIRKLDNRNDLSADVFPNPVKDVLNIRLSAKEKSNAELTLLGLDGKIYMKRRILVNEGITNTVFNVSFLSSGKYFVKVQTDKENFIQEFIK